MGCASIVPVLTERSGQVFKRDKWEEWARLASEQCGRMCVPALAREPVPLATVGKLFERSDIVALLEPAAQQRQMQHQQNDQTHQNQQQGMKTQKQNQQPKKQDFSLPKRDGSLVLLVGPEGGFTSAEANLVANSFAARSLDLGHCILRSETAVTAGLAVLLHGDRQQREIQ